MLGCLGMTNAQLLILEHKLFCLCRPTIWEGAADFTVERARKPPMLQDTVSEWRPHGERFAFCFDMQSWPLGSQPPRDVRHGSDMDARQVDVVRWERPEPNIARPGLYGANQSFRFSCHTLPEQVGDCEKGTVLRKLKAVIANIEHAVKFAKPVVRQKPGEQLFAARANLDQPRKRNLVRLERPSGCGHASGEPAADDLWRQPNREVLHRSPGADLDPPGCHTSQHANPPVRPNKRPLSNCRFVRSLRRSECLPKLLPFVTRHDCALSGVDFRPN